jgi:hypothetical protein
MEFCKACPSPHQCAKEIECIGPRFLTTTQSWNIKIIEDLRKELFSLCEDTEERYAAPAERDLEGKEGAFARGRIFEAKSIRKAMGEVFHHAMTTQPEKSPHSRG